MTKWILAGGAALSGALFKTYFKRKMDSPSPGQVNEMILINRWAKKGS